MITEIKTLADLLIRLFSERRKNRDNLMKEIVTPAFETTKEIIEIYRDLLTQSTNAANTTEKKDFDEYVASLKRIRDTYITERQSLLAIAETAVEKWDEDAFHRFAKLLTFVFFDDEDGPLYGGSLSIGHNALGYLDAYDKGNIDTTELLRNLESMKEVLDFNWRRLSSAYAELKVPKA